MDDETRTLARGFGFEEMPDWATDASLPPPLTEEALQRALRYLAIASVVHLRAEEGARHGAEDPEEDQRRLRAVQSALCANSEIGDGRLGYYRDFPLHFDQATKIRITGTEVASLELEEVLARIIARLRGEEPKPRTIDDTKLALELCSYLADNKPLAGFRYHPDEVVQAVQAVRKAYRKDDWVKALGGPQMAAAEVLAKCSELFWRPTPLSSARAISYTRKRDSEIRAVLRARRVEDEAIVAFVLRALGLSGAAERETRAHVLRALCTRPERVRRFGDPSGTGRTRLPE